MQSFLSILIILFISILMIFPLHIILNRFLLLFNIRLSPHTGVLLTILAGNIITQYAIWKLVLLYLISQANFVLWYFVYSLIVYNSFAFLYFFFLTTTETSIHFHIISQIFLHDGKISRGSFREKYNDDLMMQARLERLIDLGQIKESNNKYYIKGKFFLFIANVLSIWRKFFMMK